MLVGFVYRLSRALGDDTELHLPIRRGSAAPRGRQALALRCALAPIGKRRCSSRDGRGIVNEDTEKAKEEDG